ncbi:ankyrin repeat protein (B-cell lymphoma 3-encoded protein) [Seiridium cupressi]
MGRTPLHWAASTGDASVVHELLRAGARADVLDKDKRTPLYEACRGNFTLCAERMLGFGADFNVAGLFGYRPIHAAATFGSAEILSLLLLHNVDIEGDNNNVRVTLLHITVYYHNVKGCRYLLDLGANIEHVGRDGDTPLFTAVHRNSHESLQLLLSRQPNHFRRSSNDNTLLHRAALNGDQRTLEILAAANLKGLNIDAKDNKSINARQHFAARLGTSLEHKDALDKLITSLNGRKGNLEIETEDEDLDGDVFHDAP